VPERRQRNRRVPRSGRLRTFAPASASFHHLHGCRPCASSRRLHTRRTRPILGLRGGAGATRRRTDDDPAGTAVGLRRERDDAWLLDSARTATRVQAVVEMLTPNLSVRTGPRHLLVPDPVGLHRLFDGCLRGLGKESRRDAQGLNDFRVHAQGSPRGKTGARSSCGPGRQSPDALGLRDDHARFRDRLDERRGAVDLQTPCRCRAGACLYAWSETHLDEDARQLHEERSAWLGPARVAVIRQGSARGRCPSFRTKHDDAAETDAQRRAENEGF
jgi:hypothetical protein